MHIAVLMLALMTLANPAWAEATKPLKLVVLGDSLSAGLGLPAQEAFPQKLQKALQGKGIAVDMTNAGVSGDTSSGGRDRLDWSVPDGTDGVIVELGANDALRGIDPALTRTALTDIVQRLKARRIPVMLCGMLAPPNYGADYAARFNSIYPDLAKDIRRAALSVLPRGRCRRRQAQPGRRHPSDRRGRRHHRRQHHAHGRGIPWHDNRATALKSRQS
jgi:acyl-CoA thioesterase-1